MRILLVSLDNSRNAVIGGKHIHQELITRGWRESGHHVDMVYPCGIKWYVQRVFRNIKQVLGWLGKYEYFRRCLEANRRVLQRLVLAHVAKATYDVISAQDVLAAVVVKSAFGPARPIPPVVLTLHGYYAHEAVNYSRLSGDDETKVMEYCLAIESEALQFASGIVTVDSRIRRYVLERFRFAKPIKVIANAIDDSRFFPVTAGERKALRCRLKLNVNDTLLIVARRLVNKNGVGYAVQAMQRLEQSGDLQKWNVRMLIIGRGPEKKEIAGYIAESHLESRVKMVGVVPHGRIDAYYKAADVVLMPSINSNNIEEATSLSMLEGMACGKVVIASAIGGLKEVIVHGENGLLVGEKDADALANMIRCVTNGHVAADRIQANAALYAKKNSGYLEHARTFIAFFKTIDSRIGN